MIYGYARVSQASNDEADNLETQRRILNSAGAGYIFEDIGDSLDFERPGLVTMRRLVQEGDTVIVQVQDRLGKNPEEVIELIKELEARGITIKTATGAMLTMSTPEDRFTTRVMSAAAGYTHDTMIRRSKEGQ